MLDPSEDGYERMNDFAAACDRVRSGAAERIWVGDTKISMSGQTMRYDRTGMRSPRSSDDVCHHPPKFYILGMRFVCSLRRERTKWRSMPGGAPAPHSGELVGCVLIFLRDVASSLHDAETTVETT